MIYVVHFDMPDGRIIRNDHASRAQTPAEVEYEIINGDDYVVSNCIKHVRIKRADVSSLTIELKES